MKRAISILPIDDPQKAIKFYVLGLGFQAIFEVSYPHDPGEGTIIGHLLPRDVCIPNERRHTRRRPLSG